VPGRTTVHPDASADSGARAQASRSPWLVSRTGATVTLLAIAALLIALGSWTYRSVERSLRELRAASLDSVLDAQVRTLQVWAESHGTEARDLARSRQLTAILGAARIGDSGEVYAFDRSGVMLSESRFTGELAAQARIPAGGTTVLALLLTEPEGAGALTRLAAAALAATGAEDRRGMLLEPYTGYHGEQTIGAWRWLPQYDMGMAAEISAEEAYAPLHYLAIAFGVVVAALVIAVVAALGTGLSVVRLRRQIGEHRKLGAYNVVKRIGEGGMANVYLARHALLKRPTAVKLLKPARATDEMIARFEREVQLASRLSHPNTIEIFDYGRTRDGLFYYAMEYLDGLTVAQLLERDGALPVPRVLHLLRQVCAALAEAHAKGLVHRDIKPENVMVCRYGGEYDFVKILDFGLVKNVGGEHSRDLTRNLRILGTPLYMAPERLRNPGDVDARADIYAVGALGYTMLSGRKLFDSADDLELTSKVLNEEPPRVSQVAAQPIPPEMDLLIAACLEKERENRPQRVDDLVEALDALASEHPWPRRDAETWWAGVPPALPG
jgi:serine/threonine-protein kinase